MPVSNRIAALSEEVALWRRDLHEHPELMYDVHRTAGIVADKLEAFGCDAVVPGIGRTGVVGVIKGRKSQSGKVIGLRADMDALPIHEATGLPHASRTPGKMHACGHDGHTAMLLGAARYLAETRNFDGTAVVIFQPAEEGGAGGKAMVEDGLMERFGIQEVYGMHNMPRMPVGSFAINSGAFLASADLFAIKVTGRGGHGGAGPHLAIDPILAAAQVVNALQGIVSRNVDPLRSAVISVCTFHAGTAPGVIPDAAELTGTARALDGKVRDLIERRMGEVAESTARAYGATAEVQYTRLYPVTRNHARQAAFAAEVAAYVAGKEQVNTNAVPTMGAEDFAFMLEARPGAFIFVGNGNSAPLHNAAYEFNDQVIATGMCYWARLVETGMPA